MPKIPLLIYKVGLVQKDDIGVLKLTPHRDQQASSAPSSFSSLPTNAPPPIPPLLFLKLVEQ